MMAHPLSDQALRSMVAIVEFDLISASNDGAEGTGHTKKRKGQRERRGEKREAKAMLVSELSETSVCH